MRDRSIRELLEDILAASRLIEGDIEGLSFQEFERASQIQRAVLFSLITIGETASSLPDAFIEEYPTVPWRRVIGFRHRVVHGYFRIDTMTVWDVASMHVPTLQRELNELLGQLPNV